MVGLNKINTMNENMYGKLLELGGGLYSITIRNGNIKVIEAKIIEIELKSKLNIDFNGNETKSQIVKYTLEVKDAGFENTVIKEDQINQLWFTSVDDLIASIKIDENSKN